MRSPLIKRGLSKCCQLRMPRAAQRVVSNQERRLLADRKGQDPNPIKRSLCSYSFKAGLAPNVTADLAKAACGLDKTLDYPLREAKTIRLPTRAATRAQPQRISLWTE